MLLTTSLLSLLLSLLLFFRNENRNSNFLAAFLLILSIFNLAHYFTAANFNAFWGTFFYNHFAPLYLLLGPLIYFYVRGIIKDEFIFKPLDWIHFIPAIVLLIAIGDYYFLPFEDKMRVLNQMNQDIATFNRFTFKKLFSHAAGYTFRGFHFTAYLIICLILLIVKLRLYPVPFFTSLGRSVILKWLVLLHTVLLVIVICYGYFTFRFIQKPEFLMSLTSNIILNISGLGLVLLNSTLFFFPTILYGSIQNRNLVKKSKHKPEDTVEAKHSEGSKKDYALKGKVLDNKERELYFKELSLTIEQLVDDNQLTLNNDFSIVDVAKTLGVPVHHIRICFKDYIKEGLVEFRNKKRMEKAIILLNQMEELHLTMESIGEMAGFSSRSSFFAVFKKKTGKTPQEFVQESSAQGD